MTNPIKPTPSYHMRLKLVYHTKYVYSNNE